MKRAECEPGCRAPTEPSDEELVRRLDGNNDPAAWDLLAARYRSEIDQLIAARAIHLGLGKQDQEDARQWLFLVLSQAIRTYNRRRRSPQPVGTFAGFAKLRLKDRLTDFARGQLRQRKHVNPGVTTEAAVQLGQARRVGGPHHGQRYDPDEPPEIVHRQEGHTRLQHAVASLNATAQAVLSAWLDKVPRRIIGYRLDVSESTVDRRVTQTLHRLRAGMGEWQP
jgi:RNA polymerase sigma factor (sigma-70 family)